MLVSRRPVRRYDLVLIMDMLRDVVLCCRLLNVTANLSAIGNRGGITPGFESITERIHVAVRANAGIAE